MHVLLVPTLGFGPDSWEPVVAGLPAHVVPHCATLPGHGDVTTEPAFDVDVTTRQLVSWAEGCTEPPHVVGAGIGALLAERVSREAAVASLTVLSWPPDQRPGVLTARADATAGALTSTDERAFMDVYRATAAPRSDVSRMGTAVRGEAFVAALRAAADWRPRPLPNGVAATIVLGADDDRCRDEDARALADMWGADLHRVPASGHAVYVDAPTTIARLLGRVTSRPGRSDLRDRR